MTRPLEDQELIDLFASVKPGPKLSMALLEEPKRKTRKRATVTMADFRFAVDGYIGWCSKCQDFTRYETEPDAEHYDCPKCDNFSVTGAESAALYGKFSIMDDESSAED